MSFPSRIYVFHCSDSDLYGLTVEKDGANLPTTECEAGWEFKWAVSVTEFGIHLPVMDYKQVLVDLQRVGFHIGRHSAKILPFRKKA